MNWPFLEATYEIGSDGSNFAQKGIAVRVDPGPGGVSRGNHWQVFDHDTLRMAAAWSAFSSASANQRASDIPNGNPTSDVQEPAEPGSRFVDWHGINFDGRHQIHPRVTGQVTYANPTGPGWANPETGSFEDSRLLGRDNRHYGPLPREWGKFHGVYQFGDQVIMSYTVGPTSVLEMPGAVESNWKSRPRTSRPAVRTVDVHSQFPDWAAITIDAAEGGDASCDRDDSENRHCRRTSRS